LSIKKTPWFIKVFLGKLVVRLEFGIDSGWRNERFGSVMYTYAFFKTSGVSIQVIHGIAGDVQVIGTPVLSALVEPEFDLEEIQHDDGQLVQAVLMHDRMICDLFWQTTILPLRFGTQFISEESLLTHLDANQEQYLTKLNELEGKAEYRLRLMPVEFPEVALPDETSTGREYFLAKKRHYQLHQDQQLQQQQELQKVLAAIAQVYPDYVRREPNEGVEKLYVLVDRQEERSLYQHMHDWQSRCPHWELDLGEALPPYHFV
jgi:hypothetical protein